jgi:hypothetical protein
MWLISPVLGIFSRGNQQTAGKKRKKENKKAQNRKRK